ncbi:uncharacterized protein RJT21DRAFT_35370 [Scheffersomyces amazonensis]|uniref:uncharacterized protein n=1 Tax=Scheffersomyces amazonensis TaxID=1078765 RepID=UPI00315CF0D1
MTTVTDNRNPLDLDRERVTCLLLINTHLMKKSINIYNNMLCNPQAMQSMPQEAKSAAIESYQNCIRRLHCNLTVLNYIHEKYHNDASQQSSQTKASFPIILSPPTDMPELTQLYNKLQDLYPEAMQYIKLKLQQMKKQHFQQQQQQVPPQAPLPPQQQQQQQQQQLQQQQQQQPQMAPQQKAIQNRQVSQQQMMNKGNLLGTPNSNGLNTPSQQEFIQPQFSTFNGQNNPNQNYQSPMLQNVIPQQQGGPQQSVQAISPQQILQQMNLGPNNNPGGGLEFLN